MVLLVVGLLLKNVAGYASSQISVRVQEGLVRDLRTGIFDHLLTLDLPFFQRTRAGQLISGIITEVDQTQDGGHRALLSLFQNVVVVATTLVVLSQISWRLTLFTLVFVPLAGLLPPGAPPAAARGIPARAHGAGRGHGARHRADRRDPPDPGVR